MYGYLTICVQRVFSVIRHNIHTMLSVHIFGSSPEGMSLAALVYWQQPFIILGDTRRRNSYINGTEGGEITIDTVHRYIKPTQGTDTGINQYNTQTTWSTITYTPTRHKMDR